MKTVQTNLKNGRTILLKAIILLLITTFLNNLYAQTKSTAIVETAQTEVYVEGIVKDESGPLAGANIVLKNSSLGTVSDINGEFKFKTALKPGEILVVSYLGYVPQEVVVDANTPFMEVYMKEDQIIFIGNLNTNRIYRSTKTH